MEQFVEKLMDINEPKTLFILCGIFIFTDAMTGYLKAIKNRKINSSISRDGYIKKISWIIALILGFAIDYFVKGGPVMWPLLFCSLAPVGIGVERFLYYKQADSGKEFTKKFCGYIEEDDWLNAKRLADATKGEVAKLATIVMARHGNFERLEGFIAARAERAIDKFEKNLGYLGVMVSLSPVLGLLGTITGMISSFNALNERSTNPMAVTSGIGESLITTVFGLCISIVAILFHAYFTRRMKGVTMDIEEMSNTLLEAIAKNICDDNCGGHKQ